MDPKATGDLTSLAASFPLVVYDHGEQPDNSHAVLSVAGGSSRTCRIPELQSSVCLETPCGLVLVADNTASTTSSQCSLWNPQTGEKVPLPALDKAPPEHGRCLLSDTISSPDCLVLINDPRGPSFLFCHVNGGTAWTTQPYDIGLYPLPPGSSHFAPGKREIANMTAVQGKFYFMENRHEVGVLSFAQDPEPHLEMTSFAARMPTFVSDAPQVTVTFTYLLESSQELFLVCLFLLGCDFEHIQEVGAYKMDISKQEWCKVTDIGDRAFLLGPHSFAASCAAGEHGLKKGCVYFAFDFFGDTNDFYVFDLMEGTRELMGPGQDVPLPTRQPFWMVPVLP